MVKAFGRLAEGQGGFKGGGHGRNCRMFTRPVFRHRWSLSAVCVMAVLPTPVLVRAPFPGDCARPKDRTIRRDGLGAAGCEEGRRGMAR